MSTVTTEDLRTELDRMDGLAIHWWNDASSRAVCATNALELLELGVFELGESGDNAAVRVPIEAWRDAIELIRKAAR